METETAKAGHRGSSPSGGTVHLKKTEWPRVSGTSIGLGNRLLWDLRREASEERGMSRGEQ